jgi:hypothetical protein
MNTKKYPGKGLTIPQVTSWAASTSSSRAMDAGLLTLTNTEISRLSVSIPIGCVSSQSSLPSKTVFGNGNRLSWRGSSSSRVSPSKLPISTPSVSINLLRSHRRPHGRLGHRSQTVRCQIEKEQLFHQWRGHRWKLVWCTLSVSPLGSGNRECAQVRCFSGRGRCTSHSEEDHGRISEIEFHMRQSGRPLSGFNGAVLTTFLVLRIKKESLISAPR